MKKGPHCEAPNASMEVRMRNAIIVILICLAIILLV
jgi:hypothetical protein